MADRRSKGCHHRGRRGQCRAHRRRRPWTATKWFLAICFLVKLLVQITEAFLVPRGARPDIYSSRVRPSAFFVPKSDAANALRSEFNWVSPLFPFRNVEDSRQDRKRMASDVKGQPPPSVEGSLLSQHQEFVEANTQSAKAIDDETLPSADDLNRNLELLRRQLEEKNQKFRETVLNLQKESERTLASVEQWDEFYRTRMDELSTQAKTTKAQEDHRALEATHGSTGSSSQAEGGGSASEKVLWLAEQLQRVKSQAQQAQLESELEAKNKDLQMRLEALQDDLERQKQQTESERARYEQLWRYRLSLEAEVAEIQAKLQQSIHDLKERLDAEMEQRRADQQRHDEELRATEARHEEQLRAVREDSNQAVIKLTNDLRDKDSQYDRAIHEMQSSTSTHQIEADEKHKLEAEQARLLELLQRKERELADQVGLSAAAHEKANAQWAKRSELETELASVKQEYQRVVKEWETRADALEQTHKRERDALQRLCTQKESEVIDRVREVEAASEAKCRLLEQNLKTKDVEYAEVIRQVQQSAEKEKKKLLENVESLRQELERYRVDTDQRLLTEKERHIATQGDLEARLARKEEELLKQIALSSSVEESAMQQRERKQELDRQVAELKRKHDVAVNEWEMRLKAIQHERSSEQLRMEAKLAQTIEKRRDEIEDIRREAMRRQSELELQLRVKTEEHRAALKNVTDESKSQEAELKRKLESLANEYQRYKAETERLLNVEKENDRETLAELSRQLAEKEKLYSVQIERASAAEMQLLEERKRRSEMEMTLTSLTHERQQLESEVQALRVQVESFSATLQSYRTESEGALKAELQESRQKLDERATQILQLEDQIRKQVLLTASTEKVARQHWERRDEVEKELATRKYELDAAIVEYEVKIRALAKEHQFELQKLEALMAATKDEARVEVDSAKEKADHLERELRKRLAEQDFEHQQQVQRLQDAPRVKVDELNGVIQSLSSEIQQLKLESQRQIAAAEETAEDSKTELRSALAKVETELAEQTAQAETAENRALVEVEQRMKLEKELATTKDNFENHVAQWESRYNSLFESRNQALQKAEALLTRKEVDSRAVVDALNDDFEAAKAAYSQSLKEKDMQHASAMEVQRALSESKLQKVHDQLRDAAESYQQLKLETRELVNELSRESAAARATYNECLKLKEQELDSKIKNIQESSQADLMLLQRENQAALDNLTLLKLESSQALASEREDRARSEAELRAAIQQKEEELREQSAMTTKFRSTAEGLLAAKQRRRRTIQERDDLEKELTALKKKHQADIAGWETKYSALQNEAQDRERQHEMALRGSLDRKDSDDKVRVLSDDAQLRQRELKSEIQALAVRHVMEMQEAEDAAKAREEELAQKLRAVEQTLQSFESRAREGLEQEKRSSLHKQESLVAQLEQSQRHLEKVLELYTQEKAKNRS